LLSAAHLHTEKIVYLTLDNAPAVLRIDQAAQIALVHRETIRCAVHRGEIRALTSGRVIRISRDALRQWLMGEATSRSMPSQEDSA
jgi:excisionase family DNA binding protein